MVKPTEVVLRTARLEDEAPLRVMIDASVRALSEGHYTAAQIEGSVGTVLGLDTQLLRDGTYFVAVADGEIVASGGWSYRKTMCGGDHAPGRVSGMLNPAVDAARIRAIFVAPSWARQGLGSRMLAHCEAAAMANGYRRAEMGSTLTGVAVYLRRGYVEGHRFAMELSNGEQLQVVFMSKVLGGVDAPE